MTRSKAARARSAGSPLRQARLAGDEMAPAGMEGDVEIGIGLAGHRGGALGGLVEPGEVDRPAFDPSREREIEHLVRPLADGGRVQQARRSVVRRGDPVIQLLEFAQVAADDASEAARRSERLRA